MERGAEGPLYYKHGAPNGACAVPEVSLLAVAVMLQFRSGGGLEIRDTAGWKSALRLGMPGPCICHCTRAQTRDGYDHGCVVSVATTRWG